MLTIKTNGKMLIRQAVLVPVPSKRYATIMLGGKPIGTAWDIVIHD